MGTTPIYGFPYPDPSDLVANYPATAQQLAEDVEDAIYARKILQIVRATDVTRRDTTSTSFVDVTGMSVSITPQVATSNIIVAAVALVSQVGTGPYGYYQITDSANTALSAAEGSLIGTNEAVNYTIFSFMNMWGYVAASTTSSRTYKLRFKTDSASLTASVRNELTTGQMFAIEVSA